MISIDARWRERASGDEAPLLAASPDHYVLRQSDDGVQQVIETTGGSPLASRIFLGDADSGPVTPGRLVRAHRWHLACEFSNWIEAANASGG